MKKSFMWFPILCLLIGGGCSLFSPPEDPVKVQEEIIQYLENKYGQEFVVVEEAKYNFELGEYSLIAHPKGNKDVTFAGFKTNSGNFHDTYAVALWSKQSTDEIRPLIDRLYSPQELWEFKSDVGTDESLYAEVDHENLPDYREIRKQHPDKMRSIVVIALFKDLNEFNKGEELEKIFQILEFFREKEIQDFVIDMGYYEERLLKEQGRNIKPGFENVDYLRHRLVLTAKKAQTVHTPEDLEKYLAEYPR